MASKKVCVITGSSAGIGAASFEAYPKRVDGGEVLDDQGLELPRRTNLR